MATDSNLPGAGGLMAGSLPSERLAPWVESPGQPESALLTSQDRCGLGRPPCAAAIFAATSTGVMTRPLAAP